MIARRQEAGLVGPGWKRTDEHVVADIEARSVHPQRPAEPSSRCVDDLPEAA